MVKNPPSNAEDAVSIPGWGTKIPHAAGQLSPRTTTTELAHLNKSPRAANYRSHAPQIERSPRAATKDPASLNEDPACQN